MEQGDRTSSSGFSDEERARWGLPAVRLWEPTHPDEALYPAGTYLNEPADKPGTGDGPAGPPEVTAEPADEPEAAADPAGGPARVPDPAGTTAGAEAVAAPRPAIRVGPGENAPPAPAPPAPAPGVVAGRPARPEAEPSWLRVLATTVRLWAGRRAGRLRAKGPPWPAGRRRLTQLASLTAVLLLAVVIAVLLTRGDTPRTGPPGQAGQPSQPGRGGGAGSVRDAQAVRGQAAGWILAQASRDTIVSCDPVMCAELQSRGFPAGNLDVLRPGASDPLDSEVTVATGVLRSQFGSRLTSVYAPVVLASFGSGSAGIQVRAVAPDGAAAYLHELSADVAARTSFGRQLLRNPDVVTGPAARRQLEQGRVDTRLIAVIGTLAQTHRLRILSFGDAAPGRSAGVPLRSVVLAATTDRSPGTTVLASVRSFLERQHPPYLPSVARVVRLQAGQYALNVRFAVPDPLGLLATGHTLAMIPSGG